MERIFLYCLTWALGGLLNEKERVMLDHELRSLAGGAMPPRWVLVKGCRAAAHVHHLACLCVKTPPVGVPDAAQQVLECDCYRNNISGASFRCRCRSAQHLTADVLGRCPHLLRLAGRRRVTASLTTWWMRRRAPGVTGAPWCPPGCTPRQRSGPSSRSWSSPPWTLSGEEHGKVPGAESLRWWAMYGSSSCSRRCGAYACSVGT